MSWYNHPKYIKARQLFIESFSPWKLQSLHYYLPKIVFICGGDGNYHPNRKILESYFDIHLKKFLTFRAEDAWNVISKKTGENSLAHEEWLAGFSDVVIILVESFGTAAELGAFSISEPLRKKLLPILNKNFETHPSFLNTGPVKWVNSESKFQPCIFADFNCILTAIPDIEKRINKTVQDRISSADRFGKYAFTNKVLLFFLLQILVVLGPISLDEISDISFALLGVRDKKQMEFMLTIGVALEIFEIIRNEKDTEFYYCRDFERLFSAENTKKLLHRIQLNRARSLSGLQKIDAFQKLITKIHL